MKTKINSVVSGILLFFLFSAYVHAEDYWRDFDVRDYANEFYPNPLYPANKKLNKVHGSCGAAAAAIVYGHIKKSWINSNTVAYFDSFLSPNYNTTYTEPVGDSVVSVMKANGLNAQILTAYTTNRTYFINSIINTLKNGGWPITISRHNFNKMELAHYYPVHSIHIVRNANGTVNESKSIVYVIDSYNPNYDSARPNYSLMYRFFDLKTVIDNSMQKYLNVIAVFNK